jgi:hypothetical protein
MEGFPGISNLSKFMIYFYTRPSSLATRRKIPGSLEESAWSQVYSEGASSELHFRVKIRWGRDFPKI